MSHFTVMVIGDNPEDLLAPYDENIQLEPYVDGEVSQEEFDRFRSFYEKNHPGDAELSYEEFFAKHGDDWNGGCWKFENGKWIEYSTYNPKSKWDWYQLGGRWNGYFKLKPGAEGIQGKHFSYINEKDGRADSCLKGDIDVEGMRNEAKNEALEVYDAVHAVLTGAGVDIGEHNCWEHYIKLRNSGEITPEEARELYNEQPTVKTLLEFLVTEEGRRLIGYYSKIDEFLIPREDYAKQARDSAITPFAVLNKDGWFEEGKMGWWGMVADRKEPNKWNEEFSKLFDSLPDDTKISLFDCHI